MHVLLSMEIAEDMNRMVESILNVLGEGSSPCFAAILSSTCFKFEMELCLQRGFLTLDYDI